ncbi:MAG: 2-oxoglutarate dehydrogenase complex dihydrolipoyllysine-residue succinyltransferase, partial [Calditrichia bacterium]
VEKAGTAQAAAEENHDHRITPVAKKILKEAGIDLSDVVGSGQGGKITKEDALNAVSQLQAQKEAPETIVTEKEKGKEEPELKAGKVEAEAARPVRRQPMTTLRKTLSKRLVAAKNETAMLTTFNEVDMAAIMEIRKRYKETFKEKYDVNLGFMSFFVRAVCIALKEFPKINAKIDGEDVVYHDFVDVSIAVSSPRGLVVPVIRNAQTLQLHQIEAQVELLATKARANKLSIEEMTGGTFTISNGGVFGSLLSTPILNAPQSAILGMHKIQERPVVIGGQIVIRPMMYVALSYDHRMVDGRESVTFLVRVKEMLEDPARLLLEI